MSDSIEPQWQMPGMPNLDSAASSELGASDLSATDATETGDVEMHADADLDPKALETIGGNPYRIWSDRRAYRRYDIEPWDIRLHHLDGPEDGVGMVLGHLVDLSAGGLRFHTTQANLQLAQQIRVRLELPSSGVSPFVDVSQGHARGKRHWTGSMEIARIRPRTDGSFEIGGRLIDMNEIDRGMLGLYLSSRTLLAA